MPASSKQIRKRIKSVGSTKKITRTMEMVATSKLQRTQQGVTASRPYMVALGRMMTALSETVDAIGAFPLFEKREPVERVLVLGITANRGLCGGFNSNLVRKVRDHITELENDGKEVVLHMCGKKGIAALRFLGIAMEATNTELSDNPGFAEAADVAAPLLEAFLQSDVDQVDIVYADWVSLSRQPPTVVTLLPVGAVDTPDDDDDDEQHYRADFIFEPSPRELIEELGPTFVKNTMYRVLLSSVASEQLARRVAMKNATDNAGEMERALTLAYNQARQAQITQEIAEIVGGVEALG